VWLLTEQAPRTPAAFAQCPLWFDEHVERASSPRHSRPRPAATGPEHATAVGISASSRDREQQLKAPEGRDRRQPRARRVLQPHRLRPRSSPSMGTQAHANALRLAAGRARTSPDACSARRLLAASAIGSWPSASITTHTAVRRGSPLGYSPRSGLERIVSAAPPPALSPREFQHATCSPMPERAAGGPADPLRVPIAGQRLLITSAGHVAFSALTHFERFRLPAVRTRSRDRV